MRAEIARLRKLLEEALRSSKRQAAPFSRRHPKAHPQKPGRKAGTEYGRSCRRERPQPIDQVIDVPLPRHCPHCAGDLEETGVVSQYQSEIPEPRVEHMEFRIHLGQCRHCGRRVQGRDRRQTSRALGSASSQLGTRALALAILLNKGLGLPYGKTVAVLQQGWGLQVSRSGICQAIARAGHKAEPTYEYLQERIRGEPSVTADETGWKVAAQLQWMWVFSSEQITVYSIQPGRGFEQASSVLGEDFAGFLVRDGWSVYRQFQQAWHQTCVAHLLRRCREMIQVQGGSAAQFPRQLQRILQAALGLRQRYQQGQISAHGLAVARGKIEAGMNRCWTNPDARPPTSACPSTWGANGMRCLPFSIVRGWRRPTGGPSKPFVRWWSPAKSGVETGRQLGPRFKVSCSASSLLAVSRISPFCRFSSSCSAPHNLRS